MAELTTILENARRELLDLGARNRLINTRRSSTRSTRLEIIDEKADQVFQRLVADGKSMSFLAADEGEASATAVAQSQGVLFQPDEETSQGAEARHEDSRLQTALESEKLQKRLRALEYEANTYRQEQGVNILYLAAGFLSWREKEDSQVERQAPLVLIPLNLARRTSNARYRVQYSGEDIVTNLSLKQRLWDNFGLKLPEIPDSLDDFSPSAYCGELSRVISDKPDWRILPDDMVIWFFSFAKYLMYRDLDAKTWPADKPLEKSGALGRLLVDGFGSEPPIFPSNSEPIDEQLPVSEALHIVDADSSQAIVIEEVRRGANLAVQGPPGTGKSQTIANVIAAAVNDGKRVLFVAEKMAALEVVKRRLSNVGLGDISLELHSSKANRKAVLGELDRTLKLLPPKLPAVEQHQRRLTEVVDRLNAHAQLMNHNVGASGLTLFQLIGRYSQFRGDGVRSYNLQLSACADWDPAYAEKALASARELGTSAVAVGDPTQHPWRGAELRSVLPADVHRLSDGLAKVREHLCQLMAAAPRLAELMGMDAPANGRQLAARAHLARRLLLIPRDQRARLGESVWREQRQQIDDLLATGVAYAAGRGELTNRIDEQAWDTDVRAARKALKVYGRSWVRLLHSDYRSAIAKLRAVAAHAPPKAQSERLELLDKLAGVQQAKNDLEESQTCTVGEAAFGPLWRGVDSDWESLANLAQAERECLEITGGASIGDAARRLAAAEAASAEVEVIAKALKPMYEALRGVLKRLEFNLQIGFGRQDLHSLPLEELAVRVDDWRASTQQLSSWVAYRLRLVQLAEAELAEGARRLDQGEIPPEEFANVVELAYYESLLRTAFGEAPELMTFNGAVHEQLRGEFRQLDRARLGHARALVAKRHYDGLPSDAGLGEMATVLREINKKSRHLPIRRLMKESGRAIQQIKPVFMMSPLSVAQFLPPGEVEFDLVIIDEASQVEPVDALGALARAKQVMVVGDDKQLPPTSFFSRMAGDGDGNDDGDGAPPTAALSSVLGLCSAQNMQQRMLRWHYRSRHHSLIEFSNHEFYSDGLFVVPSPSQPRPGEGLVFHHLPKAAYARGGARNNPAEARAIAEAVMHHASSQPDRSLGVGAFSVAQRDAILDALELLRRQHPEVEDFFVADSAEPFFVKNLENIQGDERDVILISVGYGRDDSGYMQMKFGPLSNDGGERRLNVLVTRARDCCEVYSSIRADDITLNPGSPRGTVAFKAFLQYAEKGLLDTGAPPEKAEHDSEFERQVAKALAQHGVTTHAQVGVAGFRIDLAVVDSKKPGRYLLGIECDGATYHSARWARERDRLRESVLESRGWRIHRIWSTDWFHRPDEELKRALAAIERSRAGADASGEVPAGDAPQEMPVVVPRVDGAQSEAASRCVAIPYELAKYHIDSRRAIHELPVSELAKVVKAVVACESPIHEAEVARRITQLWGLTRTGSRIAEAVTVAVDRAISSNEVVRKEEFLLDPGQSEVPVRDRSELSVSSRKVELLPPMEIREALHRLVREHFGATRDELCKEAARMLGFSMLSAQLRERITLQLEGMIAESQVEEREGRLYAICSEAG